MPIDLEPIKERLEAARNELSALCKGRRWQMSIPAQPNYDSDLLIGAALRDVPALIAEVELLRSTSILALTALRARRELEEHAAAAAQYESCADCCNQRPCPEFGRMHTTALSTAATALAALRGALAKEEPSDAH